MNAISDPDAREEANIKLMTEDPTKQNVVKLIKAAGLEVAVKILENALE